MKADSTHMKRRLTSYAVLAAGLFFSAMLFADAQVRISEVMYNPEGANERRLWIEVVNVSADTLSLTAYKVRDSGSSNHAIQGDGTLEPTEAGVIVADPVTFAREFRSYRGNVYRSSLDLRGGTARSVALLNSAGEEIHRVEYSPTDGADDDGNSLHIDAEGRIRASRPTPGVLARSQQNGFQRLVARATEQAAEQTVSAEAEELPAGEQDTLSADTPPTESVKVDTATVPSQSSTSGETSDTPVARPQPTPRVKKENTFFIRDKNSEKQENLEDETVVVDKNVENIPVLREDNTRTIVLLLAIITLLALSSLFFIFKIARNAENKKRPSSKRDK